VHNILLRYLDIYEEAELAAMISLSPSFLSPGGESERERERERV
jgi:hypothetical protein